MASFDPYHKWLAIPPEEQPANHYRLLGLPLFESDADVIDAAAEQRTVFLRSSQAGPNAELAERLLNEISAARVCLLDGKSKTRYDQQLKKKQQPKPVAPQLPKVASDAAPRTRRPACGNISRIPGSTRPTADKADRHETGLRVAERLPAEPPESPPAPPPVTPPLRKPPIAVSTDPAIQVVTDASSRVAVNRDTESSGSPGNEKRRRRRKTSAAWLWGTILAGGFTIIGLAIFANYINDRKQQKTVALRDPLNTTDSSPSAAPEVDSSRPSTRPVQPLVDNPEPFAPFEDAQEPMDDPLLQQFKESEQPAPPEPSEPEGPRGFTPDAVQELYEQCHEMEWNPETLAAYGKLQALAKIVTDCGRSQESEVLDAEHKEEMLKASLRVMDSLSTIRWPEINQRTRINEFATEALQDQQQLGVFGYGEVYVTAAGQLDGADVVFFRLAGTDQHIAITVKENSGELTPGTRWLILGECNFTRGIQLMDNNTGNTIKAPLVMAYYLIQEPK